MSARQAALAALGADGAIEASVRAVGAVLRVACSDEEAHEDAVAAADRALEAATARLAATAQTARFPVPNGAALDAWLAATNTSPNAALAALDDLGKLTAGVSVLAPSHPDLPALAARVAALAARIASLPAKSLVAASTLASAFVIENGVAPGPDDALLALADALGAHLAEALRGAVIEATPRYRVKPISPDLAARIASALAEALRAKLEPTAELVELAPRDVVAAHRELVLHRAENVDEADVGYEILPGVRVRSEDESTLVVTTSEPNSRVIVVPFVNGEAAPACPSRAGGASNERVFDIVAEDELDTYALVVGDRLAFFAPR